MEMIGLLYIFLIFALCFAAVALFRLAALGFKYARAKPEKSEKPEMKNEKQPEPIYYIVEKKRARKCTYSRPKEIKFKEK